MVDNMNYEELLALEDRIGYVSTGLREDEIVRGLRVGKNLPFDRKHFSTETKRSCSICQEEFEASEEVGRLSCGHGYHVHCIKQWLSRKNACPLCKTAVSKP
ncbi:probable E3 ubiquitin-protein ligase ZFP1 [Triticum dicoccoides]|uniref:probable E3 ubiquitin-protein ligase ZFP1 n=1 Tax=Triticum dicoccoides TaxID=85692 RepID=UPI000E7C3F6F|nr:probable E3 ubiquitin-protein ligase ZFP1 [Triticum dicoccoides]